MAAAAAEAGSADSEEAEGMSALGDDSPADDSGFVTNDFTLQDIFRFILKVLIILLVLCFFGAMGPWVIFAFYSWKKVKKNFKIYINNI